MWQCPKCKRKFNKSNQNHFCDKVETIDQYISEQNEKIKPIPYDLIDEITRWRVSTVKNKFV